MLLSLIILDFTPKLARIKLGKMTAIQDEADCMTTPDSEDNVPIAEKVRFWEEQDKINQELIPRVIRQHELLTGHIADHDTLPEVVANAVQQAVAAVREEQKSEFDSTVSAINSGVDERVEAAVRKAVAESERKVRNTRNLLMGLTSAASAVALVAIVLNILTAM